jgi:hypothetical protein
VSPPDSPAQPKVAPAAAVSAAGADEVMISLYASRQKIYPRSVSGLFSKWRWITVWLTQIVFYGLPWLDWNARQAVLFDLEARRFYLFGLVLYPQDFIYLTGLLVISALALFLFTAVLERFMAEFATINSFTECHFETPLEGNLVKWPPRIGRQHNI